MKNLPPLLFANIRPRVRKDVITHLKRTFHGVAKLNITKGREVQPQDILGEFVTSGGFFAFNLSQKLGIPGAEGANYLQKKIGEKIYQGELLARKENFFGQSVVTSPTDGIIDLYDPVTGNLRIKLQSRKLPLVSGVYGIVDLIDPQKGEIWIKTRVTEIFGIFGSGRQREGVLTILGKRDEIFDKSKITLQASKSIVVAGALIYGNTLKKAVGFGVSGIISGGFNSRDYKSIVRFIDPKRRIGTDVGISVMATEGFGSIPIGEDIYNEMLKHEGEFVFLSGNSSKLLLPDNDPDTIIAVRKTILPLAYPIERQPEIKQAELQLGSKVRVIWPPFMGTQGTIFAVDAAVTKLESGISTYLVCVETPSRKIKVPYPNVELVG